MGIEVSSPVCEGLKELPIAAGLREELNELLQSSSLAEIEHTLSPSLRHIAFGLALTVGSALGHIPPTQNSCLEAYLETNATGLAAGTRAWSKHAHRSSLPVDTLSPERETPGAGWWGNPKGPVAMLNARATDIFWRIWNDASWKNLHWLPHQVLVYEIRVQSGYGMRWSQNRASIGEVPQDPPWKFRGFVEPMIQNGHELGWRH